MVRRISLITILLFTSLARAQSNDPLPTMQEMQKLFADKQYQPLLQKIARVANLKGAAAQPYDRYELLMMKGESHLQLKQLPAATAAFGDAVEEAGASKEKAAVAAATVTLIKDSRAFSYTRKSPTSQPSEAKTIDVLDISKRREAFAAIAADELAVLRSKAKNATSLKNLKPVIDLLKSMSDLHNAELAATGANKESDALLAPLAAHSTDLSRKAVAEQRSRLDVIEKSANQIVDVPGRKRDGYGKPVAYPDRRYKKRGLMSNEATALKSIISICGEIAEGDKQLAEVFGEPGKPLLEVADEARTVAERANTVLNTDYSITADTPGALK